MMIPERDDRLAALSVSGDLISLLLDFLSEQGADGSLLAQRLRLVGQARRLTFAEWWRWLDELQMHFAGQPVAVELARRVAPEHLGVIGYLALSSGTVLEAFQHFERYQRLLYEGPGARIEIRDGLAGIIWDNQYGGSSRYSDEVIHGGLVTFLRRMTRRSDLMLRRTDIIWQDLPDRQAYLNHVGGELKSWATNNALWFEASYLMLPLSPDEGAAQRLQQAADQALHSLPDESGVLATVRRILVEALPRGGGSQQEVANALAMSERTLLRRLSSCGVSFRSLQTAVRMELAQSYLRERHLTLSEVALLLGYSEQAAFNRAFKASMGVPPGEWQRRHGH